MLELLMKQMAEKQGVTEDLKVRDKMACAEEIVLKEIVYA